MASFPAFADSNISYSLGPGNLCAVCAAIPLHALPSEEEDGYPHSSTLNALKQSGQTCVMCALLYWAAGCSIVSYGGMTSFSGQRTVPSGEEVCLQRMESMYNRFGMRAMENGAVTMDLSGPIADPRPPTEADLERTFPDGTIVRNGRTEQVRPWLFGNWYKSGFTGHEQMLMIGLGIRLGTSGKIEDSVNRERDTVHIQGSYLRYRTDKGAL